MFFGNINYWTVAISSIVCMGAGFAWYSPYIFGKLFLREMKLTPEEMEAQKKRNGPTGMAKTFSTSFVLIVVMSFVFAVLFNSIVVTTLSGFLLTAFLIWIGFCVPVMANSVLFGKDSFALFLINAGYQLVNLVIISIIVGIFS